MNGFLLNMALVAMLGPIMMMTNIPMAMVLLLMMMTVVVVMVNVMMIMMMFFMTTMTRMTIPPV